MGEANPLAEILLAVFIDLGSFPSTSLDDQQVNKIPSSTQIAKFKRKHGGQFSASCRINFKLQRAAWTQDSQCLSVCLCVSLVQEKKEWQGEVASEWVSLNKK